MRERSASSHLQSRVEWLSTVQNLVKMYQRQRAELQRKSQLSYSNAAGSSNLQVDIGYGESSASSYGAPRSSVTSSSAAAAAPGIHHSGPVNIVGGNHHRRNHKLSGGYSSCGVVFVLILWTIVLCGGGYLYYTYVQYPKIHKEHHHYHHIKEQVTILEDRNTELESKLKKLENDESTQKVKQLQTSLDETLQRLRQEQENVRLWRDRADRAEKSGSGGSGSGNNPAEFEAAKTSLSNIQAAIQEQSRQIVIEKWGYGPYKVEFEIHFPEDNSDVNHYFVVELAPIHDMPHTIHTFLEQVSRGLYNVGTGGYSFHHNGGHIIQGAPIPNHLTTPNANLEERFTLSGYGHVLFQEYSQNFPHVEYTLGFTGRPYSGPNFYINTRNNAQLHGPNGYSHDGYGDPCFGKITFGIDVITRIHEMSSPGGLVRDGEWKEMAHGPIAVKSVKIISQK